MNSVFEQIRMRDTSSTSSSQPMNQPRSASTGHQENVNSKNSMKSLGSSGGGGGEQQQQLTKSNWSKSGPKLASNFDGDFGGVGGDSSARLVKKLKEKFDNKDMAFIKVLLIIVFSFQRIGTL